MASLEIDVASGEFLLQEHTNRAYCTVPCRAHSFSVGLDASNPRHESAERRKTNST